jgi:hypothetical protein
MSVTVVANDSLPATDARVLRQEVQDLIRARHKDVDALVVVLADLDPRLGEAVGRVVERLPALLREQRDALSARRIDELTRLLLPEDGFAEVDRRVDEDNADLRARFLADVPCLDSARIHARAGSRSRNPSQTASAWKAKRRIFAVPFQGTDRFPAFQFDADGRPKPVIARILGVLPASFTPWQTAFWFVTGNGALDGRSPMDALDHRPDDVVRAAGMAGDAVIG